MKIEVTQSEGIHEIKFIKEDNSSKSWRLTNESYLALESHFKPKEVSLKDNSLFDELWKIHAKGNKKTAKDRFAKAIKKISFEELKSKLEPYVKSNDFCYLKGLDVWLNPDKEYWNDPIVKKEDKFKKPEEPVKPSFFRT